MLIDDFSDPNLVSNIGTSWRCASDSVMGGISEATIIRDVIGNRDCLRLTGDVRLENDGGFILAALDLASPDRTLDASKHQGIRLIACGNGEQYSVHLRTPDNERPWQSYRAQFVAGPQWESVGLPFDAFQPYRLDRHLDKSRLRRIALVAIGRPFKADLAIARLEFF